MTGVFEGTLDFGAGPLGARSVFNLFLAKLGPGDAPLWSRQWDAKDTYGHVASVAFDSAGRSYRAANARGQPDPLPRSPASRWAARSARR